MKSAVNQAQIARASGLSRTAVSFALNERLRTRLHPETCRRVLDKAKQLGYVPHHAARRLARTRSDCAVASFDQVGLIYLAPTDLDLDTPCISMMSGAEREFSRLHASLTFIRVAQAEDWGKVERLARAGGADGWLLYGVVDDTVVNRLRPTKLPQVVLGDHRCTRRIASANVDCREVGRLAVQHLASLGHRRVGYVGVSSYFVYQRETLAGFRSAIKELGMDEDERLILDGSGWSHDAAFLGGVNEQKFHKWLRASDPMPTALFAPEPATATNLQRTLKLANLEVPTHVSVLTCELESSTAVKEGFTRIILPMSAVGREGALLLHRIGSGLERKAVETKIAPTLTEGWSTCLRCDQKTIEKPAT